MAQRLLNSIVYVTCIAAIFFAVIFVTVLIASRDVAAAFGVATFASAVVHFGFLALPFGFVLVFISRFSTWRYLYLIFPLLVGLIVIVQNFVYEGLHPPYVLSISTTVSVASFLLILVFDRWFTKRAGAPEIDQSAQQ